MKKNFQPSRSHIALIALGGNVDNPREHLENALEKMRSREGWQILARSSWRITKPVGFLEQPDFVNGAVAIVVPAEFSPENLMQKLLQIEIEEGRVRPKPMNDGPRSCDLDLLFFDDEMRDSELLQLPHPRWRERAFVLEPLIEVLEQLGGNAKLLAQAKSALEKLNVPAKK